MAKQTLTEGFFEKLAKMLLQPQISKELAKAEKMLDDDPTLSATIDDVKAGLAKQRKLASQLSDLEAFCKKHPHLGICKELQKDK